MSKMLILAFEANSVPFLIPKFHFFRILAFCAESERDNTELAIPIIQLHMIFTGYMTGYIRSLLYNIIIIFYTTEPMETIFHSNI